MQRLSMLVVRILPSKMIIIIITKRIQTIQQQQIEIRQIQIHRKMFDEFHECLIDRQRTDRDEERQREKDEIN